MSLLTAALINSSLIIYIYMALIIFFAVIFSRLKREIIMLSIINYAGLMGLAVLIAIPIITPFNFDNMKLFSAVLIELFCIGLFFISGLRIIKFLKSNSFGVGDNNIKILLIVKLLFLGINYIASDGQYGVFSNDSRIDFLDISPTISKTRYFDILFDFIILHSIAVRSISLKHFRFFDFLVVVILIVFGFLSGSKGFVLFLIANTFFFSYAAYPEAFSSKSKGIILIFFTLVTFIYVYALSEVLQIPLEQLINLSLYRFIMGADARIMAFDPNITNYVLSQHHGTLLAELFRGVARLLGADVAEFSMGVYQFQAELGTNNYVGSTGQLTAIFLTYGGDFWLLEFALVAALVIGTYKFFCLFLKSHSPGLAFMSAASLYSMGSSLAQGFEAYFQLLPICVGSILLILIFQKRSIFNKSLPPDFL